jgi:Zn-dependent protease
MAAEAKGLEEGGNSAEALAKWRLSLELLPEDSRQAEIIRGKVEVLGRKVDASGGGVFGAGVDRVGEARLKKKFSGKWKWLAPVLPLLLLLFKFKTVVLLVLTKGKFLLLGLTKAQTLFSMLLSMGTYWTIWGWKFALGLVLSIYVHEMGHVAALRRLGIRASAPMFIPGFGALVMLKQHPANPREDARIGLAGPIWGTTAAVVCYGIYAVTQQPFWAAVGRTGGWLNLFNLLPVWHLDGGRAFHAMSRLQKWVVVGTLAACYVWSGDFLLLIVGAGAVVRAIPKQERDDSDWVACAQYAGMVVVITLLIKLVQPVLPA